MSTAAIERGDETSGRIIDEWGRMDTRLVLYKTTRLLDDAARELEGLRQRVDELTVYEAASSAGAQIDEALGVMRRLQGQL
jgi:hypothetical protein